MATHPEQIRLQVKDAIETGIIVATENYPHSEPDDMDIELVDLIQGKGSSHYIAVFKFADDFTRSQQDMYDILGDLRSDILDEVATSINRKRVPNITFKVYKEIHYEQ